jgi:hypothetical protein
MANVSFPVSVRSDKNGLGVFTFDANGKWSPGSETAFLKALAEKGVKLSSWAVWDAVNGTDKERTAWTGKELLALAKVADKVEFVIVKRKWPQAVIRFSKGRAAAAALL